MTAIPPASNTTATAIYALHEQRGELEPPRDYLGMSEIGHECDRYLWLKFRMAFKEQIEGRILRLFDTGHREETRVLNELRDLGYRVESADPKTGEQFEVVSCSGHFRGHLDAKVTGLPEAPKTKHLVDVKTINAKKFTELLKNGMEKTYPKYWAEGHEYMGHIKLTRAVFIFVCKDDDRIHIERFEFDQAVFDKYEARAKRIIFSERMPEPISNDPSWYQCSYCPAREFCHETKLTKEVNCRTCLHSTPMPDGGWHCARFNDLAPFDFQLTGCEGHALHPDLVPWPIKPGPDEFTAVYEIDGYDVSNGEPDATIFSSREILANPSACANPSELMQEVKRMFPGAMVVG